MNEGLEYTPQDAYKGDFDNIHELQEDIRAEANPEIIDRLEERPITLIDKETKMTLENIQAFAPGKNILICDGYVKGMETGQRDGVGFRKENLLLIDHHLPIEEMSRQISTTNLAMEYVRQNGPIDRETVTIISHTDCDSILSSAIMGGIIEPRDEFWDAAIAADHTGEPNKIGDLLQSLDDVRDVELSLRNLELLLEGKPLEPEAQEHLEMRYKDRERALDAIEHVFQTTKSGRIAYAELDKKLDSGLFPALKPSAEIFLTFSPLFNKETKERLSGMEAKVRLGMSAPDGTDLRKIMSKVDEKWGGRWNAGSNGRNGGTEIDFATYVQRLEEAYAELRSIPATEKTDEEDLLLEQLSSFQRTESEQFFETNQHLQNFTKLVNEKFSDQDQKEILDALMLMFTLHIDQKDRPEGSPYVSHPLMVAETVISMIPKPDKDLVIAALLHDSVEDRADKLSSLYDREGEELSKEKVALMEIKQKYGERVQQIVGHLSNPDFNSILEQQGIKKNDPQYKRMKNQLYAEHVSESIQDPDVLIIKLADFSENALKLANLPEETEDQRKRKDKLTTKYLPVMKIFIEKLKQDGLYPEYKEKLENELERLIRGQEVTN